MNLCRTLMLAVLCCFASLPLYAQQTHFIFIQSQNQELYAAIINGKVLSSSEAGHVIVPRLSNGTYTVRVEFPMNKYTPQTFTVNIKDNDEGFALKREDKTWSLVNLQTKDITYSKPPAGDAGFSDMLSDVMDEKDSTAAAAQRQPDTTAAAAPLPQAGDTTTVTVVPFTASHNDTLTGNEVLLKDNSQPNDSMVSTVTSENSLPPAYTLTATGKIDESKSDTGTNYTFLDKSKTSADTVKAFIPAATDTLVRSATDTGNNYTFLDKSKDVTDTVKVFIPSQNSNTVSSTQENAPQPTATTDNNFAAGNTNVNNPYYSSSSAAKETVSTFTKGSKQTNEIINTQPLPADEPEPQPATAPVLTSGNCNEPASDNDIYKTRRKMFLMQTDDDMVKVSAKSLGKKCITTEQVKSLGGLFLSDSGRYKLYVALYQNVTDKASYKALENLLFDAAYKKRFEEAIR